MTPTFVILVKNCKKYNRRISIFSKLLWKEFGSDEMSIRNDGQVMGGFSQGEERKGLGSSSEDVAKIFNAFWIKILNFSIWISDVLKVQEAKKLPLSCLGGGKINE